MSSLQRKSAIVCGGGVAGLASAMVLDEAGYQVTLFEQKPILGGRTFSFFEKEMNMVIDNGQHLLVGGYTQTLTYLQKIGSVAKVKWLNPTDIPLYDPRKAKFIHLKYKDNKISQFYNLLKYPLLSFKDLYLASKPPLATQTVNDWLGAANSVPQFWNPLCLAMLNMPSNKASASVLYNVLKNLSTTPKNALLLWPQTDLSSLLVNPAEQYLVARGHQILTKQSVRQIQVRDQKVVAIQTSNKNWTADIFVIALPLANLCQVLPQSILSNSLLELLHEGFSGISCVDLFFDSPLSVPYLFGTTELFTHWFFKSTTNPNVLHAIISHSQSQSKEDLVQKTVTDLQTMFPQVLRPRKILARHYPQATLRLTPRAQSQRPATRQLKNLFLTGDYVQTHLPYTIESAIYSAQVLLAKELA